VFQEIWVPHVAWQQDGYWAALEGRQISPLASDQSINVESIRHGSKTWVPHVGVDAAVLGVDAGTIRETSSWCNADITIVNLKTIGQVALVAI